MPCPYLPAKVHVGMAWQHHYSWNDSLSSDGNWSTFSLRLGTPPQLLSAVVSTRHTWMSVPFAGVPLCSSQTLDCSRFNGANRSLFYQPCDSKTTGIIDNCDNFIDLTMAFPRGTSISLTRPVYTRSLGLATTGRRKRNPSLRPPNRTSILHHSDCLLDTEQ